VVNRLKKVAAERDRELLDAREQAALASAAESELSEEESSVA
jgi:hypothetical protein